MDETEEFYYREVVRENMWLDQTFKANYSMKTFREYIIKWCDQNNMCMKTKEILCYENQ